MLWVLHLLQIVIYTVGGGRADSEEIVNNNGWTPISREKVFGDINKEFTPRNNYAETFNQNLNNIADNGNVYNHEEDLLRLFKPRYVGLKANWNSKPSLLENTSSEADYNKEINSDAEIATFSNNAGQRKAKVVSTNNYINDINNLDSANILKETLKVSHAAENKARTPIKQYEVTERSEDEVASEENKFIDAKNTSPGYSETNNVFKVNSDSENNLTNRFLGILSNYNIRVNDALPNYDLSKSSKPTPPKHEYVLVPVPIRFLGRYKLSGPLLALILSNYGLNPGAGGGVRGAHRALYARPASYDIYNNQYPGLYKAYSDTDSSQ